MEKIFGFAILSLFITSILIVPFIDFLYKIKFLRRKQKTLNLFNEPATVFDKFSASKVGTPVGGGLLIIFVVTILSLWAFGLFRIEVRFWELAVLLFTFIGFGALGLYDDFKKMFNGDKKKHVFFGLRFRAKFIIQWVIALFTGFIMYQYGGYDFLYIHWLGEVHLGIFYILFAAFVIVAFVNAFNITDGLDGLSSGVYLICLSAFLVISSALLDTFLAIYIAILMGSVAAFLYFNIFPARIWLGDVGSLSLGASLAVIGLLTGKPAALALIGGVFVFEVGSSLVQILSRKFLGKKLLPIAPIHLYFLKKGWEEPKIVMRAWLFAFVFALLGLYLAFI